jgi:hypothetical protein
MLWVLALAMTITEDNHDEMMNISKTIPVFGFFYSYMCASCAVARPTWERLTRIYANDTGILLVDCDCHYHQSACDATSWISRHPTYLIIFGNATMQIRIERTIEDFSALIESLKVLDPTLPCRRDFHQADAYPYIIISYPDDEKTACSKLLQISRYIPGFEDRFLLGGPSNETKVFVRGNRYGISQYNGSLDAMSIVRLALDYFRVSLESNWNLSSIRAITVRRAAFFIVQNDNLLWWYKNFVLSLWETWCFAAINVSLFKRGYPTIEINESALPYLAILNREKTKFKLIEGRVSLNDELKSLLANISADTEDTEMQIRYIDPSTFPQEPEVESESIGQDDSL